MRTDGYYPDRRLEPPEEPSLPHCPICGEETDTLYKDIHGDIVGCECCVLPVDVWYEI